jgi:phage-related protein
MPRTRPTGLKELLETGYAESHSIVALEFAVPADAPTSATVIFHYLGTSAITADGVSYRARLSARNGVSLLRQSLGAAVDRAEVTIEDADGAFTAELQQFNLSLDGAKIRIGRVWQNLDTQQQYVAWLMSGVVADVQSGDTAIQLSAVADSYSGGAIGGGRVATRACQFDFKGRECGYTGALETCNKLYQDAGGCSGRSNQHRYGGFVHLQGRNAVGGAVGNAPPPVASAAAGIPSGVYNVVRDYNAIGNGTADDTTAIQNAIDAAYTAGGGTVWLPDKTFKVTGLTLKDKVRLQGANWRKSQIISTSNAPIITVATTATDASIETLTVKGSVSAGGSQIGINANGNAEYSGLMVRDVWIEDCGDHGFYVGQYPFSCVFKNIHVSNCADYPFLLAATIAPGMSLEDCYAHVLRSGAAVGFRIKSGKWHLVRCNGTDNVPAISGTKWAVVGKKNGVDGDVAHGGASVEFVHCNIEAFHSHGVLVYYNSTVSFRGRCEFAGNNNDGSYKAIEFDLANDGVDYYAPYSLRGMLEDTVIFGGGFSNFANSQPIHANGMPLLQLNGQGPYCDGQGSARAAFYRHTPTSTDQALPRADGNFAVQTITGATTLQAGGARYIRCNHSSAFTLTLPYAGWDARSQSPIVVVDVSSAGAGTNKITINASGGSTINGASSVEIATSKGALTFLSDGNTDYRVVQGSTMVPMFDDQANGRITTPRRIAGPDATQSAPTFTFESEYGGGMSHPSNRIVALSTTVSVGGNGQEAWRADGTSGSVQNLFSGFVGALSDNTIDIGQSGNYRFRDLWLSRDASIGGNLTVDTTTLCVDAANNRVGVGLTNPTATFEIYTTDPNVFWMSVDTTAAALTTQYDQYGSNPGRGSGFLGRTAGGTKASPSNVTAGDRMGFVVFGGYAGGAFRHVAAINGFIGTGTVSGTSLPAYLNFMTTPDGSVSRVERMRISQTGQIGIGTAGEPATSAMVEISSTTGALLLPRMTTTQRDALTAVNGMLIYNSTTNKFQGYENGAWTNLI